jgi:aryl-alcohol dehydrogenase-like predicted oxidoreductase
MMTEQRPLGGSGLSTSPLALGGNVFGWTIDSSQSFTMLDAFVAGGGTLIDTADVYSNWHPGNQGGESESIIGDWLACSGRRNDVLIATKVGWPDGAGGIGLKAARIAALVEDSLRRLRTDHIDVYFAHRDDPDTPLEESLEAFDGLVKAGNVRALGASNFTADRLAEALRISDANGWARFTVLEPHYNLLERGLFEGALQDLCVAENIGVIPYWGIAGGYLTGKYRTETDLKKSPRGGRAEGYMKGRGPAVIAVLDEIAAETGASLAAIALAWLASQPAIVAPISSATSRAQLDELLSSLSVGLTPDQLARLDEVSAPVPA